MAVDPEKKFVEETCLPFLRSAQNADGGWGFHPGAVSRAEPTCWALQALLQSVEPAGEAAAARGLALLRATQLGDGSWPSTPEEKSGCWVTSLCCWTLQAGGAASPATARGLRWIGEDWPRDTTAWRRLLARLSSKSTVHPINPAYRGWGWTPGTSSWVEPTSFALLAIEQAGGDTQLPSMKRRRELAESMLYDRMCPGGGWNCGNPRVYGVDGEPLVVPTVWALLALRHRAARQENVLSLDWLARGIARIRGSGSLALAKICMDVYGRSWPAGSPTLSDLHAQNGFLDSVQVAAWACLAAGKCPNWLTKAAATERMATA
jgi:hypothetical protein